jgi:hypothetical protein
MTFTVGKVYTFKLNSGEEVVAKVTAAPHQATYIEVSEPVSIAPSPQGMGLVPSMFTADPSLPVTINTSCVSMYALTEDSVNMKYLEATTGIKVPDKKIIMG